MQIQQTDIFGIDQTSQLSLDKNDPSYSQTRNCLQLSHVQQMNLRDMY